MRTQNQKLDTSMMIYLIALVILISSLLALGIAFMQGASMPIVAPVILSIDCTIALGLSIAGGLAVYRGYQQMTLINKEAARQMLTNVELRHTQTRLLHNLSDMAHELIQTQREIEDFNQKMMVNSNAATPSPPTNQGGRIPFFSPSNDSNNPSEAIIMIQSLTSSAQASHDVMLKLHEQKNRTPEMTPA